MHWDWATFGIGVATGVVGTGLAAGLAFIVFMMKADLTD